MYAVRINKIYLSLPKEEKKDNEELSLQNLL
jgi:hypothetical protein